MRELCDVCAGVNASLGDPDTPLGKVVRILNNQLQALTHVDERTASLQARLDAAPQRSQSMGIATGSLR